MHMHMHATHAHARTNPVLSRAPAVRECWVFDWYSFTRQRKIARRGYLRYLNLWRETGWWVYFFEHELYHKKRINDIYLRRSTETLSWNGFSDNPQLPAMYKLTMSVYLFVSLSLSPSFQALTHTSSLTDHTRTTHDVLWDCFLTPARPAL